MRVFGAAVAVVALVLQLAAAVLSLRLAAAAPAQDPAELARLFEAHALCLAGAGESPLPAAPANSQGRPAHHAGACCPGHCGVAPGLPLPSLVAPARFARAAPDVPSGAAPVIPALPVSIAQARAPPTAG